jgi:hypothetical protein
MYDSARNRGGGPHSRLVVAQRHANGSGAAFYTLLSVIPLLLVAISIAGLIYGPKAAESGLIGQLHTGVRLLRFRPGRRRRSGRPNGSADDAVTFD